jgi:hypothetical protein
LATKKDFISDEVNNMHVDEISEMIRAKIEIVGGKALYVSSFYNAKTSNEQNLMWFDQSVRQACKVNNAAILIGGDFNLPGWDWENKILKPNTKHQKNHYNLTTTLEDVHVINFITNKVFLSSQEDTTSFFVYSVFTIDVIIFRKDFVIMDVGF